MKRLQRQQGQSLVGVLVLLAMLFFVGTAMSLSVSTSLIAITQGAAALKSGYAAESAAAHGASLFIQGQPDPTSGVCNSPTPDYSINQQMVSVTGCTLAAVDTSSAAPAIAAAPALVPLNGCSSSPVAVPNTSGSVVWTAIAWHALSGNPRLYAFLQKDAGCPPDWPSPQICRTKSQSDTLLYFSCPTVSTGALYLQVYSAGGSAQVSGFLVRSATTGGDCVVTVVGQQMSRAAVEADVLMRRVDIQTVQSNQNSGQQGQENGNDGGSIVVCHQKPDTSISINALHRILP